MCLSILPHKYKGFWFFKKRIFHNLTFSASGKTVCWKVYFYSRKEQYLQSIVMKKNIFEAGDIVSDRFNKKLMSSEKRNKEINLGIHVFTQKNYAENECFFLDDRDAVIVPVTCKKSDLVAEGYGQQAVFTKVKIEQETWDNIFPPRRIMINEINYTTRCM